jgi:beta-glucosidase
LTVSNIGEYDEEEVIQLYIQDVAGSVTRPVKELKRFKKVMIKKGATKKVSFTLTSDDLAFYTQDMSFKAESGDFKLFAGTNSQDLLETNFILK